jgi:hypothetical protein
MENFDFSFLVKQLKNGRVDKNYLKSASYVFNAVAFTKSGRTPIRTMRKQCDQTPSKERALLLKTALQMLSASSDGNL